METIEYELDDHVATIALNRPDKLNAINLRMRCELGETLEQVRDDDDVWVVVLTGRGKAFCAGHDLSEPASLGPGPTSYDLFTLQNQIYKPVIAAVRGVCAAQGGGMTLLSDIRVAGSDLRMGWPQVRIGITSVSGPSMFARMVPQNIALEYLLTGAMMNAEQAHDLKLVNHVVEPEDVLAKAYEIARAIASNAPLAVRATKEIVLRTKGLPDDQAFRLARLFFDLIEQTDDAQAGLEAFNNKTTAVWKGQ